MYQIPFAAVAALMCKLQAGQATCIHGHHSPYWPTRLLRTLWQQPAVQKQHRLFVTWQPEHAPEPGSTVTFNMEESIVGSINGAVMCSSTPLKGHSHADTTTRTGSCDRCDPSDRWLSEKLLMTSSWLLGFGWVFCCGRLVDVFKIDQKTRQRVYAFTLV